MGTTYRASILVVLSCLNASFAFSPQAHHAILKSPFTGESNLRQQGIRHILKGQKTEDETTATTPFFANNGESIDSSSSRGQPQEILDEASDALNAVGWSAPMMEEELTSDDPFVQRINAQIQSESGVDLDELLNPAKVSFTSFHFDEKWEMSNKY
jgi:flagellar hook-associated protein FlgK